MNRSPSMFDVAKLCGVSHQTVSRVINGSPNVSAATKAKVLAAIEQLGYQQNLAAKALATGRSQTIGVVSFDSTLYGPTAMLHSLQVAAREHGYRVVLNSVSDISNAAISDAIADLNTANVDGILVIAPRSASDDGDLVLNSRVPVVFREIRDGESFAVVDIDQMDAARRATALLASLGHRDIAHISGPLNWITAARRREGWAAVADGPEANGDWTVRSGYEACKALIASGQPFTAIFAANDAMAFGAMRALREANLEIPTDVSLIGFDDIAEAEFYSPALSTVRQDFDTVGEEILARLLAAIETGSIPEGSLLIPGELVLRASVQSAI
jgi:DNA-binding LacI/PurR family transcriptional regulator